MGVMTEYLELVQCCVDGGMPIERATDHTAVMDWLGNQLQIAQSTRFLLQELNVAEALLREQAQQLAALRQELSALNKRCDALEAAL